MRYPVKSISSFGRSSWDYLSIGATPASEPCIQVGEAVDLSILECEFYIDQLIRKNGAPPDNARFFVLRNFHDFGTYYEAAIQYDPNDEKGSEYAFQVENGDDKWDELARRELTRHNTYTCKHG
jgi:hypothetical protein